jgi:ribosomal protein L30E
MGQGLKIIPNQDQHIRRNKSSKNHDILFLEDGKVVSGYNAALIYIMNGLARAVYVVGKIPSLKQEILSSNCIISSIPIFNVNSSNNEYNKGSILTVIY